VQVYTLPEFATQAVIEGDVLTVRDIDISTVVALE